MLTLDRQQTHPTDRKTDAPGAAGPRVLRPGGSTLEVRAPKRANRGRRAAAWTVAGAVAVVTTVAAIGVARAGETDPAREAACRSAIDGGRERGQIIVMKNQRVADARVALVLGDEQRAAAALEAYVALSEDEIAPARAFNEQRTSCLPG